jgi:DNA recombination protein RmuC
MRQLSEGPGNVIRQVEMMRDLGVKPDKSLPEDLLKIAMPDKD